MAAKRLVRVNQAYFIYPAKLTLNDDVFLMALLKKSKESVREVLYDVDKGEADGQFHFQLQ